MKRYEVELTIRETVRYVVEATDPEAAERAAAAHWQRGDTHGQVGGTECRTLEAARVLDLPDERSRAADREAVLRFLRDRELVIERLSEDAFDPVVHDAISAEEVARHLNWTAGGTLDQPDTSRAARSLERLCMERRVVCFSRPRARGGEQGEIRLYCTPQHLERLAALIAEPEPAGAA